MRSGAWTGTAIGTVLCWLGLAGAAAPARAADGPTLIVDGGSLGLLCSDTRSAAAETLEMPFCTVDAAVRAAPAGATVLVRRASYGKVIIAGVQPAAEITVAPYPGERPTIAGMDIRGSSRLVFRGLRLSSGIFAEDSRRLQFADNELAFRAAGLRTPSGFILRAVDGVLIQGNRVTDGLDGVNITSSRASRNVAVIGNEFRRLGADGVHVGRGAQDVVIARNIIQDCRPRADIDPDRHSDALQALGPTRNLYVVSNFVSGGRGFLFMVSPDYHDEAGYGHEGLVVANNVLTGPDFGIRMFSSPGARVVNNTVWGQSSRQGHGIDVKDRAGTANARMTGLILANNIIRRLDVVSSVDFAVRDHNLIADGALKGPNDLPGSPAFVDAGAGDMRLRPDSRGVDAGSGEVAPPFDFHGLGRRGRPDIGAYEVGGLPLTTPAGVPEEAVVPPAPAPRDPADAEPVPVLEDLAIAPGVLTDRDTPTPVVDLAPRGTLGRPGGATLAWRSPSVAAAFIRVERRVRGVRRAGSCVPRRGRRGGRSCRAVRHVAWLVRVSGPGVTTMGLTGRLGDKRLRPGSYRATLALVDRFGRTSGARAVGFRVRRP